MLDQRVIRRRLGGSGGPPKLLKIYSKFGKLPKTPLGYYWPRTQRGTQPPGRPHGPLPRAAASGGGQARRRSQGGKPRSIVPESGLGLGAKGGPYAWSPPPGPVQAGPGRPQACGPGLGSTVEGTALARRPDPREMYGTKASS